jgi:hypothetical protein
MTLPTVQEVKDCYPEFRAAPSTLVDQKIAEAASELDATTWGSRYTRAVMLYTAHLLALTPEGEKMRLKDGSSVYQRRLDTLKRAIAIGRARVA